MDEQKLKEDIKSISGNIGVPEYYIESAIKEAEYHYNRSNCARKMYGDDGYNTGIRPKGLSESLFGVKLF